MLSTLNAGQEISLTVERVPLNKGGQDTIVRLMRRDPAIRRGLARAQELRRRRMNAYIRGGRMWYSREEPARIARCVKGAEWSMTFTHDIAPDLASVEQYLSIRKG
jgi:hypothetical protein